MIGTNGGCGCGGAFFVTQTLQKRSFVGSWS